MIRELKTRRSCFGFAALFLVALSSCGEGYRLEPAVIDVSEASDVSKSQLLTTVSRFLKQQGFDYLGRNDRMIALLQQQPESMANSEVIARLRRQLTFLTPAEDLRVEWMDYVD